MKMTFVGNLSLQIEDEWLFEGRTVPVVLTTSVDDAAIAFDEGKVRLVVDLPVDLKISDQEWSRAVGELLARSLGGGVAR